MLQVSPNLLSAFLAHLQSLSERLRPSPDVPPSTPIPATITASLRLTAGFHDPRLATRVAEISAAETELARNPHPGLERRRRVLNFLHRAAASGRAFDPYLLEELLRSMNSPDANAFLHRWGRGAFYVLIASDHRIDERLRRAGYRPAGQISFYAPAAVGENAPWILLRDLPPIQEDGSKPDVKNRLQWVVAVLERLMGAFHEEDHFLQFSAGHGGRKNFLVNETMALLREYEIRLSLGDASIGKEAARREQTVAEYLRSCAAADVPESRLAYLIARIKAYLRPART